MLRRLLILATTLLLLVCVLGGCAVKPLEYNINFKDGETFTYKNLSSVDGTALGDITYTYTKEGDLWLIEGMYTNADGGVQYGVYVNDTLQPTQSWKIGHPKDTTVQLPWHYKGTYKGNTLDIEAVTDSGTKASTISINGRWLDVECIAMAMRGFDLKEGFSGTFYLVNVESVSTLEASADVTAEEYKNGVECYHLELRTVAVVPAPLMDVWYSADEEKRPIAIEQRSSTFVLQ